MPLIEISIACGLFFLLYAAYVIASRGELTLEDLNHLLSVEEDELVAKRPETGREIDGRLFYRFSMGTPELRGIYVYHYDAKTGERVETVDFVAVTTKSRLYVEFQNGRLIFLGYHRSLFSIQEAYERSGLRAHRFIALHALAVAHRISEKKAWEAQPV